MTGRRLCREGPAAGFWVGFERHIWILGELRAGDVGRTVRLSGWVHRKRDHGGLLFIDLRDHYGLTQCVFHAGSPHLAAAETVRLESVITVTGAVVAREASAINPRLPTGEVEVAVQDLVVQSAADTLPLQVNSDAEFPEETRLRHRFLDLRREKLHRNVLLRSRVIASIRRRMIEAGFTEFSTPLPFPRIPYDEALARYGSDKPDLRNPVVIEDVTDGFRGGGFAVFAGAIEKGAIVRGLRAPGAAAQPRSFFDKLNQWARDEGAPGLGYVVLAEGAARGPIAKFLDEGRLAALRRATGAVDGDAVFFVCDKRAPADRLAGKARTRLGEELDLIEKDAFRFCWVTDFPMYERDEETGRIEFSHNPFSMPQGGLEALETQDPLTIKAYQYDIVCNGVELSSGAIRNHRPDIMFKAFAIAGYSRQDVEARFGGMLNTFRYGAPPHRGSATSIDPIVMLLTGQINNRQVIAFPMNQQAQDLLLQAPAPGPPERVKEAPIQLD